MVRLVERPNVLLGLGQTEAHPLYFKVRRHFLRVQALGGAGVAALFLKEAAVLKLRFVQWFHLELSFHLLGLVLQRLHQKTRVDYVHIGKLLVLIVLAHVTAVAYHVSCHRVNVL